MASVADFQTKLDALEAAVGKVDADVDGLTAEIATLREQLQSGGLSSAEEDVVLLRIDALQAKVDALDTKTPDKG